MPPPSFPRSLHRPLAVTEGRLCENVNKTGVRLWTGLALPLALPLLRARRYREAGSFLCLWWTSVRWRSRSGYLGGEADIFHSSKMTVAHYEFTRNASIHEHHHVQEEIYEVTEGELELTVDGVVYVARPGVVGIVPSDVRHSVKALTDGRAIIVDSPARPEFA